MFPNLLTPLQSRVLSAIAGRLEGVFLTGGTALGPFHLGHRVSVDLDLFTRQRSHFDERVREFATIIEELGLSLVPGHTGPGFRRFVVSDGNEEVPVDLVLDTTPAISLPIVLASGLAIDSLEDIAANKLTTVLGRAELRDYVDLFFLERAGVDLLGLLPLAQRKDGGLDAATLAYVLSEVKVNAPPTGLATPVSASELQSFVDDLRRRFARAAFPEK